MSNQRRPTTYLSREELTQIAAAKLDAAAALPPSAKKEAMLRSAGKVSQTSRYQGMAEQRVAAARVTAVSDEASYRAYIVGSDGHFTGSKEFVAATDEAALDHARQLVDGHDVELWSGGRFVAKMTRDRNPKINF